MPTLATFSCCLERIPGARAGGGGCAYLVGEKAFEPCFSLLGESSSSSEDADEEWGIFGLNGNDCDAGDVTDPSLLACRAVY